jgi:fructoselysine 6-kinase
VAVDGPLEVACIGDNCVDVWIDESPHPNGAAGSPSAGPRSALAGGNAFNVAVSLARRGRHAGYFGAVGSDDEAELIIEAATAAGVGLSGLRRLAGATGRTVVARGPEGERRFVSEEYGVAADYELESADLEAISQARWAHFARQHDMVNWLDRIAADGTSASCDLGLDGGADQLGELAGGLDVVFLSESAGNGRTGEQLLALAREAGARLAVVTLGARGSIAAGADGSWQVQAVPVTDVVDTLGAGDAYIAAFIAARLDGAAVHDAMRAGAEAGAAACRRWGLASPAETGAVRV